MRTPAEVCAPAVAFSYRSIDRLALNAYPHPPNPGPCASSARSGASPSSRGSYSSSRLDNPGAAYAAATPITPPPGAVVTTSHPVVTWTVPGNEQADDVFIANKPDVTPEGKPRTKMIEVALYKVKNDKVVEEKFFYGEN